jgi:hypothetical protein
MRHHVVWLAAAFVMFITLHPGKAADLGERNRYGYADYFQEDAFARHFRYADFDDEYEHPRYAYPPHPLYPPYYGQVIYHYQIRYHPVGTFHHYHPLSPGPPALHRETYRAHPPDWHFPFFPHRSRFRPGQFWWVPDRRHRRTFWHVIRPVAEPDQHYSEFFEQTG